MQAPPKQLITVNEFLATYSLSRASFYRLVNKGDIAILKIGKLTRIHVSEAERWLKSLNSNNEE